MQKCSFGERQWGREALDVSDDVNRTRPSSNLNSPSTDLRLHLSWDSCSSSSRVSSYANYCHPTSTAPPPAASSIVFTLHPLTLVFQPLILPSLHSRWHACRTESSVYL